MFNHVAIVIVAHLVNFSQDMDFIKSLTETAIGHDEDIKGDNNKEVAEEDIIDAINETHGNQDVEGEIIEAINETSM